MFLSLKKCKNEKKKTKTEQKTLEKFILFTFQAMFFLKENCFMYLVSFGQPEIKKI